MPLMSMATEQEPIYAKVRHSDDPPGDGTNMWFITCDEGWRSSIVCDGMYERDADWLLSILGRQPFSKGR